MYFVTPQSPQELASALGSIAWKKQTITLCGNSSKVKMAGPVEPSAVTISTTGLTRVLSYEPKDLTISLPPGLLANASIDGGACLHAQSPIAACKHTAGSATPTSFPSAASFATCAS